MQPLPHSQGRTTGDVVVVGGIVVLIGMLVIVILGGSLLVYINWDYIGQRFGPSCAIGISGTAATITVQGWTANQVCDATLSAGSSDPSVTLYRYQGEPQGAVLCQYTSHGDLYTVRDQGVLDLVGSAICTNLNKIMSPA